MVESNETILAAAFREFNEETGLNPDTTFLLPLGKATERSGKIIHAWAFSGDCDTTLPVNSNLFLMEWPSKSGKYCHFPEIDRLTFCTVEAAAAKIEPPQRCFIRRLEQLLIPGYYRTAL
jgi:predicted NUDIX family NTP pyrophosphohydrolase